MLFKRTRKPRKHKRVSSQTPAVLRRPQDFLDGDMEKRPATEPGRHRGPSAPLAGQIIGVRPVPDQPTRVLRAVSDATAVMPAATALPPSVTVPVTTRANLQKAQTRVVAALGAPAWPASSRRADGPWFRPGSDTASMDLSLATFHRTWLAQMSATAPTLQPSSKTVVMTAIGRGDFPGSGVAR